MTYKVHIGYTPTGQDRWRKFDSLNEANEFVHIVFAESGKILTIVKA